MHRFTDPDYADLTVTMRTGTDPGAVFDALHARGDVLVHPSDVERTSALAELGSTGDELVVADTREHVARLNAAIRERRATESRPGERRAAVLTARGEEIGIGDRVATRRNDPALGVANRQTWTVTHIGEDGSLVGHASGEGHHRDRWLPAYYASQHVELAYATTAHGPGRDRDPGARCHRRGHQCRGGVRRHDPRPGAQHRPPRRRRRRAGQATVDRGVQP